MPRTDEWLGYGFLIPIVVVIGLLMVYPAIYNVYISLTSRHLLRLEAPFIGLANYVTLVYEPEFWTALSNGIFYAATTTVLTVGIGIGMALVLNERIKGRTIATQCALLPYLLPTAVAAMIFRWLFNDIFGILNYTIVTLGITPQPIAWLGSPETAMLSVILTSVWRFTPFALLPVLAHLQVIPSDWYEAAKVDGASRWRRFRFITLPELRAAIVLIVLLRFVWMFNMFDVIWLLTQGGPARTTEHLPVYAYLTAFRGYDAGLGSATSIAIFMVLLIVFYMYSKAYKVGE